jgi:uncharacterized Ntn-hydrolase superfamily protein
VTFSIVGCDLAAGDWGVAVASKFPAVGAVVPGAVAGVGAVATQAWANTSFGPEGLRLMAEGRSASEALDALVGGDEGRGKRQAGLVDASGSAATFTGNECMEWAGGLIADGCACQGNILTGRTVVEEMAGAFVSAPGELVDRLLSALKAAEDAGGDRRGKQSAAILVVRGGAGYGGRNDRYVDLRVDDHEEPVRELLRIFEAFDRQFLVRDDPLLPATGELVEEVQRRLKGLGYHDVEPGGGLDRATRAALEAFAGEYNLESKIRSDDQLFASLVRELRDLSPEVRG